MKVSGETKLLLVMGAFVLIGGGTLVGMNMASGSGKPSILPTSPTPAPSPPPVLTKENFDNLIKNARYVRGDANAPMTIVEFADFECPSCRKAFNDTIHNWEKDKKPIRFVFYNFPWAYHPRALPAARAVEAAGKQGKFWPMYDALFDGETTELTDDFITSTAEKVGLNMTQFDKDWKDPATTKIIEQDQALGNKLGIKSTPSFIVRDKTGGIVTLEGSGPLANLMSGKKVVLPPPP